MGDTEKLWQQTVPSQMIHTMDGCAYDSCKGYSCLGFTFSFKTKLDGLSCSFSYSLKSLLVYFPPIY